MKKWAMRILLLLALCGLAVGGAQVVSSVKMDRQEEAAGQALKPSVPPAALAPSGSGQKNPGGKSMKGRMPFEGLKENNQHTTAWLELDNTQIDYPVVQGTDNEYYLYRDVNHRQSIFGALFLDYRVRADFSDFNNVIYGHHVQNNPRMFGTLIQFRETDFFDFHQAGTLYTPERDFRLEIFAAALTTPDSDYFRYALLTPHDRERHLEMIRETATQYRDIGVTTEDRLLILSTCSYEFEDARTVVVARLAAQ